MRKISHIRLSTFLIDKIPQLRLYKKSLIFGGLLPDCVPSFIYRRHTIDKTLHIIESELLKLSKCTEFNTYFCRHLGIITHYLADYFTLPHNKEYTGGTKKHNEYELRLKNEFNSYLNHMVSVDELICKDIEDIIDYIKNTHEKYIENIKQSGESIKLDCINILKVNVSIIIHLIERLCEVVLYHRDNEDLKLAKV